MEDFSDVFVQENKIKHGEKAEDQGDFNPAPSPTQARDHHHQKPRGYHINIDSKAISARQGTGAFEEQHQK